MIASSALLRHADDRAQVGQRLLGEVELLFARVRSGAEARDPLVDGGRSVRHRPHDGDAVREARLDPGGRDRSGHGEHRLPGEDRVSDLVEQRVDVLRLHGDDDERGARRCVGGSRGRVDAVALAQLGDTLGPPGGGGDLAGLAPAGREKP